MTSTPPSAPVRRGWKQVLDQRIDLLQFGIKQGDSQLLAAIVVQDQSSTIDWSATFYDEAKALGPAVFDNGSEVMRALEDRCQGANKVLKADTEKVEQSMRDQAGSNDGQSKPAWKKNLDNNIDRLKAKANEELEGLRTYATDKIDKLPERLQEPTVQVFNGASNGVAGFLSNSVHWLMAAYDTISAWVQQAWAKVKQWATATKDWFQGAWATVKGWFSGSYLVRGVGPLANFVRDVRRGADDTDNLSAIRNIAGKLQCMGLDSFTIVKKGHGWVLEIDSP